MKYTEIEKDLKFLTEKEVQLKNYLKSAPEKRLEVDSIKGFTRYYLIYKGKRIYMNRNQMEEARTVAQMRYYSKLLKEIIFRKSTLEKFVENCSRFKDLESFYYNLKENRKSLINPMFLSDEDFAANWQKKEYKGLGMFRPEDPFLYTEKGERVRSKSEIIIANMLKAMDIPYRYEYPLKLKNTTIYPDFMVLNKRTRKVFYLEHLGMLDDPKYLSRALEKIEIYSQNNFIEGVNIIFTREWQNHPINSFVIKKIFLNFFT